MPVRLIIIVGLLLLGLPLSAQDWKTPFETDCDPELLCEEIDLILDSIVYYLEQQDGANAYQGLKALEACDKCPEHRDNLGVLSDEIIRIFRAQNKDLDKLLEEQKKIVDNLTKTTRALRSEQDKVERQLKINESMTKDALISNYLRLANRSYETQTENGRQEARWLADFAYNYVDSTHFDVKKMMYRLLNDELVEYYGYDPLAEEESIYGDSYENIITAADWSPDGNWLAAGMDDGRLLIYDSAGTVVFYEYASRGPIVDLDWNMHSQTLAFVQDVAGVGFVEHADADWRLSARNLRIDNDLGSLCWSPTQADRLAVATLGTDIYFFMGTDTEPNLHFSEGHNDWIRDLAWSPDGKLLLSCDDEGKVIQWSTQTGKLLFERQEHDDYVRTVAWHPNGETFLSGGDDNQLIVWDRAGNVQRRLEFDGWVYQARYSVSGKEIGLVVGEEKFYRLTENERFSTLLEPGVKRFAWRGERNTVEAAGEILLGKPENDFAIPNQVAGSNAQRVGTGINALDMGTIDFPVWSPDGTLLAYAKDDKLEMITPDSIISISLDGIVVTGIAWHPGLSPALPVGNFLATLTDDFKLRLWDVATLSIVNQENLTQSALDLAWSPDGEFLAVVNVAGELLVYDEALRLAYREQLTNDFLRSVAWSPNGRHLAIGSDDNTVIIFDWANKNIVQRPSGHNDWVREVGWLSDNYLYSSGDDEKTIIWGNNNRTGEFQPLHTLTKLGGFHVSTAFQGNSSGGMLAVASTNGGIGLWRMGADYTPAFDRIIATEGAVNNLSWRPKSEDLVHSGYAILPPEINRFLENQAAYASEGKPVLKRSLDELVIGSGGGLTDYFYLPKIQVFSGRYDQVVWSPDDKYLAYLDAMSTESPYNRVEVHDMEREQLALSYGLNDEAISWLTISPDGRHLVVAPATNYFVLFDLDDPADSLKVSLGAINIANLAWSDNGRYLAVLSQEYELFLYDIRKGSFTMIATGINDYDLGEVLFHPQRERSFYIINHHGVYEVDGKSEAPAKQVYAVPPSEQFDIPQGSVRGTWIEGGNALLYAQQGLSPVLLDIVPGLAQVRHRLGDPENFFAWNGAPTNRLYEIHPLETRKDDFNGRELEYARVWDITAGEPVGIQRGIRTLLVNDIEISNDGRYLAGLGEALIPEQGKYKRGSISLRVWDLESQENIFDLPLEGTQNVMFSPSGNYLYSHFANGQVGLWPLRITQVNRYLANTDKDLFLERLSSQDNQPFLELIEAWELEKGINFKEENFSLIKRRENAQIRRNWGEHYVDQAWLKRDEEAVADNFAKAVSLHYTENGARIRPTEMDTLSLVNIWIERTYYLLRRNNEAAAETTLLNAQRLRPELVRLEMLDLLLAWQEARREPLVQALLNGRSLALQEEYENWDRRDIHLKDERFYLRLVALVQDRQDLVSPVVEPTMAALLQDLDPQTREALLVKYYRLNAGNPILNTIGVRQNYFEAAVAFLEANWAATQADSERLQDYISYNYYLQDLELQKKKPKRAAKNATNNLRAAETLLASNPENTDYQALYLATEAELAMLELRLDQRRVREINKRLTNARRRYPDVEAVYLDLQLANSHLLMGEEALAYQRYYRLLEAYDPNGIRNLMLEELTELNSAAADRFSAVADRYVIYRTARDIYWQNKPFFSIAELEAEPLDLSDVDWADYERITKAWYDASIALNALEMLPKDSLVQHLEEYNRSTGDRVYLMLYSGNWELIPATLEDFRADLPLQKWPLAVDAVLAVLKDEWSTARRLLNQVRKLPNDGIRTDEFPELRNFLLNLPAAIREKSEFRKRLEDWRGRLY